MLYKKVFYLLFLILLLGYANGAISYTFQFRDPSDNHLNNVKIWGFTCRNVACSNIDTGQWGVDTNSGSASQYTYQLPNNPAIPLPFYYQGNTYQVGYYLLYYIKRGYGAVAYIATVANGPGNLGTQIHKFAKLDHCDSEVNSFIVQNDIGSWLPLVVNMTTDLHSTSIASLRCTSGHCITYPNLKKPTNVNNYLKLNTTVDVIIHEKNAPSQILFTDSLRQEVIPGTPLPFNFEWNQLTPGNFTVNITSRIVSGPCNPSTAKKDSQKQDIEVFPNLTDETCVIKVDNYALNPTSPNRLQSSSLDLGLYYYFMDLQYMGEYRGWPQGHVNWYDITILYKPVKMDYKFEFINRSNKVEKVVNGQLQKAFTSNIRDAPPTHITKTFPWVPASYGNYKIKLTSSITDSLCVNTVFSDGQREITRNVKPLNLDGDDYAEDVDCDDTNRDVYPGAPEICDGVDNDCDVSTPQRLGCACNVADPPQSCSTLMQGICADLTKTATCISGEWEGCPAPGPIEICGNTLDDDCNGKTDCADGACSSFLNEWFHIYPCSYVTDGNIKCQENYYNINKTSNDCEYACTFTSAIETCDGRDNNCNGETDEGLSRTYYNDSDGDGFGNEDNLIVSCTKPVGFVTDHSDCNDKNSSIKPGVEEVCDNIDHNCNDDVKEGCACTIGEEIKCLKDCEEGDASCVCYELSVMCSVTGVYPSCDYESVTKYEETEKTCDSLDNDCDGKTDELSYCCNPNIADKRICKDDSTCPGVSGFSACNLNSLRWDSCKADCPAILNGDLVIKYPKDTTTYQTFNDFVAMTIDYSYTGVEQCQYRLNQKPFLGISSSTTIEPGLGENVLAIKCGAITKDSRFFVVQKESTEVIIEKEFGTFEDEGLNQSIIDAGVKQKDLYEIDTGYSFEGEETIITHKFKPDKSMEDTTLYLHIPKCLTQYLDDIEFDMMYDTVIKDDPLIAWHFQDVDEEIDLSYRIRKEIPEDCLKQIRLMGLEDKIKSRNPVGIAAIIIPIIILIGISLFVAFNEKLLHKDVEGTQGITNEQQTPEQSEVQNQQKIIENLRNRWINVCKQQNFHYKEQAYNYLTKFNLPENDKILVIGKLKLK